ncbi:glycosyltransferase family 2 protein [Vibrio metschnikovii]|uniref:Glycosyltransferase family 2 protein n=1 Tax=bacterium 19PA01SH03 TaxID=2920705 RepID=A0AAU6SNA3_UNCXX|nr:glycosyltransferase family 2 protein [Vibrio metschnikovii]EKO3663877.1 glycosyltransferase family 2 protein [Vibrio metschnikovii]EKO3733345.1 glycosyltransferase family 2 protein [Vibrio metschnikovii]EKO3753703.1 glycosyltransferase family 2 protein [Vibrio metschnikovii]
MNKANLVSIIMPGYNCQATVENSINSVLSQTYENWELIFVDDCSTDNTSSLVTAISDKRIKYYCLDKNSGRPTIPRNFGISKATGQYIAFLDSDDLWSENKLDLQLKAMSKYGVFASAGYYNRVNSNQEVLSVVKTKKIITYKDMLSSNHIGNLTGIYDSTVIGKVYQKDIGHEDYLMWLNIINKTDCIVVDEIIGSYLVSENSISSNKLKAMKWHYSILYRELDLGLFKSIFYFLKYASNAIRKRV